MTAVVTDNLKHSILKTLLADYNSPSSEFYIGLARSEYWDSNDVPINPVNSKYDIIDFKSRLQAVKQVEAASFVVPRQDWAYGVIYPQWDDRRSGSLSLSRRYYVLTDNYGVYICLRTGKNKAGVTQPSLVKPSLANADPFETSDGYVWKFLYTVSALKANYFLSSQYMPVHRQETAPDSNSTGIEIKQWEIQNNAVPGRITSFAMTNEGSGYGTAGQFPTISVVGNGELRFPGAGDSANLILSSVIDSDTGRITAVKTDPIGTTLNYLDSYTVATMTLVGGGGDSAQARPIIGPTPGFGFDPVIDLKADALMFRSKILETDNDFILSQDFRQIGLIKDPLAGDSIGPFRALTGIATHHMKLSQKTVGFSKDKVIEGVSSGARGYIDNFDSSVALGTRIFYHQSPETGFKDFKPNETIQEIDGSGEGTIGDSSDIPGEVDKFSGAVLYLDNRSAVQRTSNQSEDIKVIIQL